MFYGALILAQLDREFHHTLHRLILVQIIFAIYALNEQLQTSNGVALSGIRGLRSQDVLTLHHERLPHQQPHFNLGQLLCPQMNIHKSLPRR